MPDRFLVSAVTALALLFAAAGGVESQSLAQRAPGAGSEEKAAWVVREALALHTRADVIAEMNTVLDRWPRTEAALDARRWLIEDAVVAGEWARASAFVVDDRVPADSLARLRLLSDLARRMAGAPADSVAGRDGPVSGDPDWEGLEVWVKGRRALHLEPEGESLRLYLGLEGRAREEGWLGLWLAGFLETPRNSPAWDAFDDIWKREQAGAEGGLEGRWIERAAKTRPDEKPPELPSDEPEAASDDPQDDASPQEP